jgi:hypothetical protein
MPSFDMAAMSSDHAGRYRLPWCHSGCLSNRTGLQEWNSGEHLLEFELSLSMGISEWRDGQTLDEMLDAPDRAMYMEKDASK